MASTIVYTAEEAAEVLKVGRSKIYDLIRENKLRSVKIGGSRRIPARAVEEFVNELMEGVA